MLQVYTAPEAVPDQLDEPVEIFLAGSIEQNKATRWQDLIIEELADLPVVVYNPRRPDWDSSWGEGSPQLIEQINWELDHFIRATIRFVYLEPGTMSPISLMELGYDLGLAPEPSSTIVVCPPGFWRRTNVTVACQREGIKVYETLGEGIEVLQAEITRQFKAGCH